MAIKLVDELKAMGNFPIAHAEGINLVKTDGTEDNLQNLFDNGELGGGGGDSSVTLTQQEYEALSEEQKLDGLYYTYDTKRIYKNGVQYGASDAEGIGYNNAESGIQATTVQGAIDKVVEKVDGLISDTTSSTTSTWSSQKTSGKIAEKVGKTDIATTIDGKSTDTQVPSAKAVWNKSKNKIQRLLDGVDIIVYADSISNEMVTDTVRIMNATNSPYGVDNVNNDFHYTIYNVKDDKYKRILAYDIRKNDMYMIIKNNNIWGTWAKLATMDKVGYGYEIDGGYRYGQIVYDYTEQRYVGLFQLSPYEAKDNNIIQDFAVVSYSTYAIEKYKKYGTSLLVYPQNISTNITSGFLCRIQIIK